MTSTDDPTDANEAPTRREYVQYGGAVVGGSLLAGCTGGGDGGSGPPPASTATDAATATTAATATDHGPYTVEVAPTGGVTFEGVPQRWAPYCGGFADMGVALGQAETMTGGGNLNEYYTYQYEELPGVTAPTEAIENYPEVRTKEAFYELDNDVHFYDPQMLINWFDWSQADVREIAENVGPFLGNLIFRRSDEWHDYRYYTLYEAFETVAAVFQAEERYAAFERFHDEYVGRLQERLPPETERPEVFLTYEHTAEPSTFSPYRLDDAGTSKKQWRDLGVRDALADTDVEQLSTTERGELDYENLLEIDPDVILVRGHERKSPQEFRDVVLAYMEDHPVGSELRAVRDGRVYRGGPLHQGPIHNLFLTERAAKQLYPHEFGAVTDDAELFDRERVADVVTGAFER